MQRKVAKNHFGQRGVANGESKFEQLQIRLGTCEFQSVDFNGILVGISIGLYLTRCLVATRVG